MEENKLSKAEIFYQRHLQRLRNYNKEHADVIRARARKQFQDIKADPEKYKVYLEKKKQRYKVQNPKIELHVKEFE
jgi:vacuolar-type H+-ATPase subunit H